MSTPLARLSTLIAPRVAESALRVKSQAVYLALVFGAVGAIGGLLVTLIRPEPPLAGPESFGVFAAFAAAGTAALVSGLGYVRARYQPGQEWRQNISRRAFVVSTAAVVIVHTVLAFLGTYVTFFVLSLAFIGLPVSTFFGTAALGGVLALSAYLVLPSVASITTQRMALLLMTFVVLGALTSAVTAPFDGWWRIHFSQLGAYNDISSAIFNGTLIAGGVIVAAFAVYLANDMKSLVEAGKLSERSSPAAVSRLFVIMGVMLSFVGLIPVDVSKVLHTIPASGMAVVFLILLIRGPRLLAGMPPTYFVSAWGFLVATIVTIVLFLVGFFSLTALEMIVFGLIFGWITVFISFLGLAGDER
jgi:hypothetical protein